MTMMLGPGLLESPMGVVTGNIFIKSRGLWYNSNVDGSSQQDIPMPSIDAADDLYVLTFGSAVGPVNSAAWTAVFTTPLGGTFRCYRRRATGDANDVFTIATHTVLHVAMMCAFGNTSQPTSKVLVNWQGGASNTDNDLTWTVDGMAANTSRDPDACVMLFASRVVSSNSAVSVDGQLLPEIIGQIAVSQTGKGRRWVSWEFDEQIPSIAYANFLNIPYSPSIAAGQYTIYQRFGLF